MTSFGMSNVREAVENITVEFKTFVARQDERVKALEHQLANEREAREQMEVKLGRLPIMGPRPAGGIGGSQLASEYKAFGAYIRNGDDAELKTMRVGSDPDGGYLVPATMSASMTQKLFDQSPIRQLARVEVFSVGDAWEEPVDNDDVQAEWVGELEARDETETAQLGMLRVPCDEMFVNYPLSQRLLEDADRDIGAWADGKIADRFARKEGEAFVTGNGIRKPRGFLAYPTSADADASRSWGTLQHVNSGAASTVTADGLRDLYWAMRSPYRAQAAWVMASSTANAVDKLKDGNGDYLWRNSSAAGVPPTLLGLPVAFDENMPGIGAGTLPIALADWKRAYLIVEKKIMTLLRDPFSAKPKVLLYARRRVGGAVANSEAIKLQLIAA
ncbi:MAG: phage major capsid protein [Rhodospirillales bacterium]|nr:phage major capsid protein [Rhodospirillales bacterium]